MKNLRLGIVALVLVGMTHSSCSNWSKAAKGGAGGAAVGGTVGGIIGKKSGNTVAGILIGAAIGGAAGAAIGRYMDKQAQEIEKDIQGAQVERIGEGIKLTFDSGILFAVNSAELQQAAKDNISELSKILQKYPDTEIVVQGHTDSTGGDELNQRLSEQRAASVADYAASLGITRTRMTTEGFGKNMPVASNDTPSGRQQNRRVEIAIFANDKLKKAAERGEIK